LQAIDLVWHFIDFVQPFEKGINVLVQPPNRSETKFGFLEENVSAIANILVQNRNNISSQLCLPAARNKIVVCDDRFAFTRVRMRITS